MFSSIYNRGGGELDNRSPAEGAAGRMASYRFSLRLRFWQTSPSWAHSKAADASGRRADRASFLTIRISLIPAS